VITRAGLHPMRRASVSRVCLPFLLLFLAGCTQWNYALGPALPEGIEDRLQGVALAQVLSELGPPLRFAASDQGLLMAWEAWRIRESALGLSLGWAGADVLTLDWGNASIRGDYLLLTFDTSRRVSASVRVQRDANIGSGAALQPFYGFVSVVDVQDLLQPLPQHSWGASQLLPPGSALNNPQRPGMGDTGLEQRGTPTGAGQRSAEWLD
jgi:hypothetical protein